MENTLAIVKPDAVMHEDAIVHRIVMDGFKILAVSISSAMISMRHPLKPVSDDPLETALTNDARTGR
jgi:hypothetical protein